MKKFFIFFLCLFLYLNCSSSKSSDKEKDIFILGFIITNASQNISTNPTSHNQSFNCSMPNPSFSTLAQSGTTSSCAGCHSGSNPQANFDITSYNSVLSRVQVGNPEASLLYQKITTGSMKANSTQNINQAVYCWIKGGANP